MEKRILENGARFNKSKHKNEGLINRCLRKKIRSEKWIVQIKYIGSKCKNANIKISRRNRR